MEVAPRHGTGRETELESHWAADVHRVGHSGESAVPSTRGPGKLPAKRKDEKGAEADAKKKGMGTDTH